MNKISVIIPLYNREAFILPCLQSVMNQTYRNLEALVIDDGSTDRGPEICREFGRRDSRIKLYSQKNGGVSSARNRGLELAQGEYIFFLDSDDAIHPLLLESSIGQMEEHHIQLTACGYARTERVDDILASPADGPPCWQRMEGAAGEAWFHTNNRIASAIGGKMIRRDLIGDLRFDETLRHGEDTLFLYRLICQRPRISFTSSQWYYYRIHPGSLTNSDLSISDSQYFECSKGIRDSEWHKGRLEFALIWERMTITQIKQNFLALKKLKNREGCAQVKHMAAAELRHPLYRRVRLRKRFSFVCCLFCPPVRFLQTQLLRVYYKCRNAIIPQFP